MKAIRGAERNVLIRSDCSGKKFGVVNTPLSCVTKCLAEEESSQQTGLITECVWECVCERECVEPSGRHTWYHTTLSVWHIIFHAKPLWQQPPTHTLLVFSSHLTHITPPLTHWLSGPLRWQVLCVCPPERTAKHVPPTVSESVTITYLILKVIFYFTYNAMQHVLKTK